MLQDNTPDVCAAVCGDGMVVHNIEVCDDGNNISSDGCSGTCDIIENTFTCRAEVASDRTQCVALLKSVCTSNGKSRVSRLLLAWRWMLLLMRRFWKFMGG